MINVKLQTQNNLSNFNNFDNSHLSIQLSLDGFAFSIFDKDLVDVIMLKSYEFSDRPHNPEQLLNHVKEIYQLEPILYNNFESVKVSHSNNLSAIVPETYYDENNLSDYLKYSIKVLDNDNIQVDHINDNTIKNIYIPFIGVNEFLKSIYDDFESVHSSSILISSLMGYFKNTIKKYFFVNVTKRNLEIIYMNNGVIQLNNSFLYHTKEDFIYYILYTMEQLNLDADAQPITFIGDIDEQSELYAITYQYVRHLDFLNVNNFSLSDSFFQIHPQIQRHQYFELLNQF